MSSYADCRGRCRREHGPSWGREAKSVPVSLGRSPTARGASSRNTIPWQRGIAIGPVEVNAQGQGNALLDTRRALRGLTTRAVLIGIVASVFLSDWTQYAELVIHGTQLSFTFPPIGGFFVFLCIYLLFNVILRAIYRPAALSPAELVVVFATTVMASGIASTGLAQCMIPMIGGPLYYASPENGWQDLLLQHVPSWVVPGDTFAVRGLFDGWPLGVPWDVWRMPLLNWTVLVLALYVTMMALVTLLRRQWIERERLLFPLVLVPLRVVESPAPGRLLNGFLHNRYTWAGFAVGFGVHLYNGLHEYHPALPVLEISRLMGRRVMTGGWPAPWNALGPIQLAAMPMIIGLSFVLTREVALSLWVFYWMGAAERVLGRVLGVDGLTTSAGGASWPFPGQQTAGAYLAVALVSIWVARRPLADVVTRGLMLRHRPGEEAEPLPLPAAVWAGLIAFAGLIVWSGLAGAPPAAAGAGTPR